MSAEPTLFRPPPPDGNLTDRQRFVLLELRAHLADGLTADEVGALLCERHGKHDAGSRCQWCASSGREVLRALRRRGLVKQRRRGNVWVALSSSSEAPEEGDIPY